MTALFVSDLHLDATRPDATECFLRFLAGPARNASSLYILGDLFEVWMGDDAAGPHERKVLDALGRYTATGGRGAFLPGNRDFLVGSWFTAHTGMEILPDEAVVDVYGARVLLMHGDTLCTDDQGYQAYRRFVHRPVTQAVFLAMPVAVRSAIARYARRKSATANAGKAEYIMDVSPSAVLDALRRHGVSALVHGHTHRPAFHALEVDGRAATRIVLGAWHEAGNALRWDERGPELVRLPFG